MLEAKLQGVDNGSVRRSRDLAKPHYKWIVLSNTTLGVLMASINASILLIALPDIFRGVGINPLAPGNTSLLQWLIMGYMVVTAVLVVTFGRLGDMYGRVKMYNASFAIFTVFSIALSLTWLQGTSGVLWMIIMRVFQGVGGAMLMANSSAIIIDAFPVEQRGLALGLNQVGDLTFAVGLVAVLVGITYGIQPYGGHTMGWTNPWVLGALIGGALTLCDLLHRRNPGGRATLRVALGQTW